MDTFSYRLLRSARKTLSMEITRSGDVIVRAPFRASEKTVHAFVASRQGWALQHLARLSALPPVKVYTEEEIATLKQKARTLLPGRIKRYADLLGVQPTGLTITRARTRYGSCSSKKRLSFSCFLMLSPEEAIDYVVVHELCHLIHMNHSPRFYEQLSAVLPDWCQRKARLHPLR